MDFTLAYNWISIIIVCFVSLIGILLMFLIIASTVYGFIHHPKVLYNEIKEVFDTFRDILFPKSAGR